MKVRLAASAATLGLCLTPATGHAQNTTTSAAAAPSSATAQAQTASDTGVQDIVVTAQLRRENAQRVPISVTAIGGDALARSNVASLQDLSGAVPSLVVSKAASYGLAPISIRGLGGPAGGGSLFTDQPVAVYVDGVYVPALGQSVSDFLDLDSVQVLRGPQGTLYGRNSTAGAVLLTSRRPTMEFGGEVHASYGSFDELKTSGALNIPLVSDELALRIAVGHNSGGDWAHNSVDNRRFGGGSSTSERASLRFKPAGGPTIDLIVDHATGDSRPATVPLSTVALASRGPTLGTVYVGDPYQRRADYDSVLDSRTVQIASPQFTHTRSTDATLLVDWKLGAVTLSSISGYRKFEVSGAQDATPFSIPAAATNTNTTDQKLESYSQELRLSSGDAGRLKWTVGLYYFHQDTNAFIDIVSLQGGPPVATGIGPRGPLFTGQPAGTDALFQAQQKVDSYAAFGNVTYDLSDQLSVIGGLRYSRDHKDATIDNTVRTITNTILGGPLLSSGTCPSATMNCVRSYQNVSPRAVINFKPATNNLLYASFSKGFNSGGFNNFGNTTNPTDPTNPLENSSEKITSWEIGSKNDFFDRALRLNLSAYLTNYDDLHIRQAVLTGGVAIVNVPKAQVKGLELESVIAPIRGVTLTLNGSYLDGKIKDGTLAALPTNTGAIIVGQNVTVVPQDVAGNQLTRAPHWQGYASLNYSKPVSFGTVSATGTIRAQSKSYFLETNQDSNQYVGEAWREVDVRLAVAGHDQRWEIALTGRNIFDNRHISQIVPFTGFPIATLNTPRSWGVSGSFKF